MLYVWGYGPSPRPTATRVPCTSRRVHVRMRHVSRLSHVCGVHCVPVCVYAVRPVSVSLVRRGVKEACRKKTHADSPRRPARVRDGARARVGRRRSPVCLRALKSGKRPV